ncbi:MAG TPA: hypothetical protein VN376_09205 [Longilinea sp.]|nr:hypothetical protein [Longilinea sp.]
MKSLALFLRRNRAQLLTVTVLLFLLVVAIRGMEPTDASVTILRGLSVAAVTFLVASGFSLIFGLLDVLNLAHGTLFMIGAYVGWMVYIRPDTFLDILTPICLIASAFVLLPLWDFLANRLHGKKVVNKLWPWIGMLVAAALLYYSLQAYPITIWDAGVYSQSPGTYSLMADTGSRLIPAPVTFGAASPMLVILGIIAGSILLAFSLAGLQTKNSSGQAKQTLRLPWTFIAGFTALLVGGILILLFNTPLTTLIVGLGSNWLFFLAILVAFGTGFFLGSFIESTLIRPLYSRPIYQLMITLGLSAVGIELVRAIWGRSEFTMPKPEIFNGAGENCPATSILGALRDHCSTIFFMDSRIRIYNEVLIPVVGVLVLIGIWLLLKKTRIGMVIRAGVQDREMVEALGINVRKVFTFVFALGVALASLGGILAGPSMGLSASMGDSMILNALIALAIGGLTSYPGAAAGSLLVGLLQQFIIKYGQIGITLPFLSEPFMPSPPLVPASTVLLMVIILLVLPNGLFGRKE